MWFKEEEIKKMSFEDMEKWKKLARAKERARFLIHRLAPNARSPEWWFGDHPICIIAEEFMCEDKPNL